MGRSALDGLDYVIFPSLEGSIHFHLFTLEGVGGSVDVILYGQSPSLRFEQKCNPNFTHAFPVTLELRWSQGVFITLAWSSSCPFPVSTTPQRQAAHLTQF